jgi:predicted nucleic acid-binding protein
LTILDASVALKWFVDGEPLAEEARRVLDEIERDPRPYMVPELFMNEMLAVLSRLPGASAAKVQEALSLIESLGIARAGNGHELLTVAADLVEQMGLSGYDAIYAALASLTDGVWLTADAKAAHKLRRAGLAQLLGQK